MPRPAVPPLGIPQVLVALIASAAAVLTACAGTPTDETALVRSIVVTPAADSLAAGDTSTFEAIATDASGKQLAGVHVRWSVDDAVVARIDGNGRVTALAPGSARLTASAGSTSGHAALVVTPAAVVNCSSGTVVAGGTIGAATWSSSGGPYCLRSTVVVAQRLMIEAGTAVYAAPAGALQLAGGAVLQVTGTEQAPVLLAPASPDSSWGGIHTPSASCGLGGAGAGVTLQHTWLRRAGVGGCASQITIADSRLDTAGVGVAWYGGLTIDRSLLRGAGIGCARNASVRLHGVRIEGSDGPAIYFEYRSTTCFLEATGVRIVGNGEIGYLSGEAAQTLLTEPGAADSLAGNVRDRVELHAVSSLRVAGELALPGFEYAGYAMRFTGSGVLRLAPGARLSPGMYLTVDSGVRVIARGTPAAPVVLASAPPASVRAVLGGIPGAPSVLSNVRVEGMTLADSAGRPLQLDSARVTSGGRVALSAAGSRVTASAFDSAGSVYAPDNAALSVGAGDSVRSTVVRNSRGPGIRIQGPAALDSCEVTGSAGDGVVAASAAAVTIHHCNLRDNTGVGARNLSTDTLDARFNWWGDPAGPNGPAGDGVAGLVNWSGALGAAVALAWVLGHLRVP